MHRLDRCSPAPSRATSSIGQSYCERFNAKLRGELLNGETSLSPNRAQLLPAW